MKGRRDRQHDAVVAHRTRPQPLAQRGPFDGGQLYGVTTTRAGGRPPIARSVIWADDQLLVAVVSPADGSIEVELVELELVLTEVLPDVIHELVNLTD